MNDPKKKKPTLLDKVLTYVPIVMCVVLVMGLMAGAFGAFR